MNRFCFSIVFLFLMGISIGGFAQESSKILTVINPEVTAACPDCAHMPDMYRQNCNVRKLKDWVKQELQYPQDARERKVEGEVKVGLTINKDGKITSIRLIKKIDKALDAEALRLAQVLQNDQRPWLPGKMRDKLVNSEYELSIPFVLNPVSIRPAVTSENQEKLK